MNPNKDIITVELLSSIGNTETLAKHDVKLNDSLTELMKFSVPYMASAVIDVSRTFIGNMFLAKLGSDSNAAGALISTSQLVLISVSCCSFATGIEVGKVVKLKNFTQLAGEDSASFKQRCFRSQ